MMRQGSCALALMLALLVGAGCSDSSGTPADGRIADGARDTARDTARDVAVGEGGKGDRGADMPADIGAGERTPDVGAGDSAVEAGADGAVDTGGADAKVMCGKIRCDCTLGGKNLWGKVKYVNALADFKIREVTVFGDLKVRKVSVLPTSCGKWQVVQALPDFTVQVVSFGEDFQVRYVNVFPGVAKP